MLFLARIETPYEEEGFINKDVRTIGGGYEPTIGREEGVNTKEGGGTEIVSNITDGQESVRRI